LSSNINRSAITLLQPRIALTSGEPAGIGSDLCIQLAQYELACELIVIAEPELLLQRAKQLNLPLSINTFNAQQETKQHISGTLCGFCKPNRRRRSASNMRITVINVS
jgi:4-hydroxy-L-threonine phosphate dehydrogenase PdxA